MRIASIDLGTNTFNLLIVDIENNNLKPVYRTKKAVKLGKGGINNNIISNDAWLRGINTLQEYSLLIKNFNADKVIAIATSAIRNAKNGNEFVKQINEYFNINIEIIDGKTEALYIFEGVKNAIPLNEKPVLIMDIGGGSVEFIIANNQQIFWHNSFELGIARLLDLFKPSDPITHSEIEAVELYLSKNLVELSQAISTYIPQVLIGSSGSFDALANMTSHILYNKENNHESLFFEIPPIHFENIYQNLIHSTLEQRKNIPGMDLLRIEMIVLGSVFINFILKNFTICRILQSSYAIKEGVIFKQLHE